MKTCAVIPAAGSGTRLGLPIPKILLPVTETETVLSILYKKLSPLVDHIHIIISARYEQMISSYLSNTIQKKNVSISIQPEPKGMGDAIFQSYSFWETAEKIIVIWGDQVFVSEHTLKTALLRHAGMDKTVGLPLTRMPNPYVEYVFDQYSRLIRVNQSREGEVCSFEGLSDVGTFILSVRDLYAAWENYLKETVFGAATGEINFLPFLPFLDRQGWQVKMIEVSDLTESRGINTADDLLFFQQLYAVAYG
ncbi:MAG TPA: sugar phosphate nucleotidyltransferase [Gammaproteobacteria bacterium]|nr:sugar phosphate nucleotidyltransferase [Gammaproteobacteria bacterium]